MALSRLLSRTAPKGLNEDIIRFISQKDEPDWMWSFALRPFAWRP